MNAVMMRRLVRNEQLGFWRNPDYAFFTFALPLILLVLIGTINAKSKFGNTHISTVTLTVPGIMALAIVMAAYANLATRIAVLRSEGVLKRIRTLPVTPGMYLSAHLASTLVTVLLSVAGAMALGFALFGVAPRAAGAANLVAGAVLGIVCFAALGLAISCFIPHADAAGPITNATYLPLAIISGVVDPSIKIPAWLSSVVGYTPIRALNQLMASGYASAVPAQAVRNVLVLVAWSSLAMVIAQRRFRWQPTRT